MVARQHSRHGLPRRAVSIAIMGLLGLLLGATSVFAQERSVRWARWDVRIDNVDTAGNQFRVAETQVIEFTGTYSFGSRTLPLRRLTDIQNITVTQAGQPLSAGCDDRPGAYCVSRTGDGYSVKYYFTRPVSDSQVQIELAYTVLGALRIRPESDELFWSVISAGKPGPVASGRVVVVMPDRFAPQPDTVLVTGVGANVATQGGNITATMLGSLPAQTAFEIQFRYPHNSDAVPPPWQKAEEDAQTAIERNLEQGRQIAAAASRMNGLILVGAVLIGLLTAFPMLLVLRRSRPLPKAVPSADDRSLARRHPAQVGYLIDGRLKPPHVLGALFNLAREGYLTISANAADDAQIGQLTLQRTGRNIDHLSPFDTVLLAKLFGTTREISLVKNYRALHRVLPKLERIVEADLFQEELLDRQLALTRHTWRALGRISPFVIVAAALIGFLLAIFILPRFMFVTDAIRTLVVVAAIVIGIIFVVSRGILAGRLQPLTERGIAERNTWLAYKEYLKRPDALRAFDLKRFEQLFPIAVTMGLDSTYLDQFTTAEGIDLPAWVSLSGAVTLAAVGTTITQMMTGLNAWLRPPVVMSTSSSTYYDQTHWSTSAGSAWSSSSNFSSDSGGSSGGDSGSSGGGDSSFG